MIMLSINLSLLIFYASSNTKQFFKNIDFLEKGKMLHRLKFVLLQE